MTALGVLENIINDKHLSCYDFKYCLVAPNKQPFKIDGSIARPNNILDFVNLDSLLNENIDFEKYAGLGISIQGSNVCAIDLDHCVDIPFDINSINEKAKNIINMFKNIAYVEFSFSGKGIRIIFKSDIISDYEKNYYIKNSKEQIEYYQPGNSYRYVTITGKSIFSNPIKILTKEEKNILFEFLNKYMKREIKTQNNKIIETNKDLATCFKLLKICYIKDFAFQDLWFSQAPGSGQDESERDYHIISYIYEHITTDKDIIKKLFEDSPYFKSKDKYHIKKWNYNNFRYYNYIYNHLDK